MGLYLLLKVLQGNIIKILVVAIVFGVAIGLYRYSNSRPYYSTEVKFLVSGVQLKEINGEYTVATITGSTGMAVGSNIAQNAPYILQEDRALDILLNHLQEEHGTTYQHMTRRKIRGMMNVSADNQIVTVRVTSTDKQCVLDVAAAMEKKVPACLDYYFGVENTEGLENIASVAKALSSVSEADLYVTGRNTAVYALVGFVVGAAIVYLFFLLRTFFDHTVYGEEDLKNRFTIPVIGQIPTWENARAGTEKAFKDKSRRDRVKGSKDAKSPDSGNFMSDRDYEGRRLSKKTPFAVAEAFKMLRTNMTYTTKGEKCAVYGITSAYVSAGKSLIVANLAISFAQLNKKVLLVDGDLRCPVQQKIFGFDRPDGEHNLTGLYGLSDYLGGICAYDDIHIGHHSTDPKDKNDVVKVNLDIITSGNPPPNPAELLASDRMRQFIELSREKYDVVFIDLPPVCEVSDAGVISDLVTGYAFVVRAGYSDCRMIEAAVEIMEGFGASFAGFILNDIDIKSGDYYKNKYYNHYGKYRSRRGKRGYYSRFKYGYGKGYGVYGRGSGDRNVYANSSYGNSYSRAQEKATAKSGADEGELTCQTAAISADEIRQTCENQEADFHHDGAD